MKYYAVSHNRETKAKKIEAVLRDFYTVKEIKGKKILDMGCGSGHISEYFSYGNEVTATDVVEQITVEKDKMFNFRLIDGPNLPFDDSIFDIVIFNHVFICVSDHKNILRETYRILKNDGICYFATENRYFPYEECVKLPILHYLPQPIFRAMYKRIRKTDIDLYPVGYHRIKQLIGNAGFKIRDYTKEIIMNPERFHSEYKVPLRYFLWTWISPTVIFVLFKNENGQNHR